MTAPIRFTTPQPCTVHVSIGGHTRYATPSDLRLALASLTPEERAEVIGGDDRDPRIDWRETAHDNIDRAIEAERSRDALARLVGKAIVLASLAPGESLSDKPEHALIDAIDDLRAKFADDAGLSAALAAMAPDRMWAIVGAAGYETIDTFHRRWRARAESAERERDELRSGIANAFAGWGCTRSASIAELITCADKWRKELEVRMQQAGELTAARSERDELRGKLEAADAVLDAVAHWREWVLSLPAAKSRAERELLERYEALGTEDEFRECSACSVSKRDELRKRLEALCDALGCKPDLSIEELQGTVAELRHEPADVTALRDELTDMRNQRDHAQVLAVDLRRILNVPRGDAVDAHAAILVNELAALRARLAAYENGDDVDRVGRVVRQVETWTEESRLQLLSELARREPRIDWRATAEDAIAREKNLRAKLEAAEKRAEAAEKGQPWCASCHDPGCSFPTMSRELAERLDGDIAEMQRLKDRATQALELRDAAIRDRDAAVKRAEYAEKQRDAWRETYRVEAIARGEDVSRLTGERDEAKTVLDAVRGLEVVAVLDAAEAWCCWADTVAAYDLCRAELRLCDRVRALRAQKAGDEVEPRCETTCGERGDLRCVQIADHPGEHLFTLSDPPDAPEPMTAEDALELKARRALDGWLSERAPNVRTILQYSDRLLASGYTDGPPRKAPTHLELARKLGLMGDADGAAKGGK